MEHRPALTASGGDGRTRVVGDGLDFELGDEVFVEAVAGRAEGLELDDATRAALFDDALSVDDSSEVRRLIGVYDADGSVVGELSYFLRARIGRAHCRSVTSPTAGSTSAPIGERVATGSRCRS